MGFPITLIYFLLFVSGSWSSKPCLHRQYPTGIVCVCNATYCDEVEPVPVRFSLHQAMVYTSTAAGKRLDLSVEELKQPSDPGSSDGKFNVEIEFDTETRFQEILGFGGAFTDSVGANLKSLSAGTRKRLLRSYFGQEGIDYSVGRVPMASCDFSTRVYSYCDRDGDFQLANFSLAPEDLQLKIPFIQEATWLTNGGLRLFASPWSAPAWMKETGRMVGGGPLRGPIGGSYYATWADYFVRFFEEYQKRGVEFWGLTLQNEPSAGLLKSYSFQAMFLSAAMQRDFVRDLLGPRLRNNSATAHLKVMINDDNRIFLPSHPDIIFADPKASALIDGVGVHWYWNKLFGASRLSTTHKHHPDKFILSTEACNGWDPIFTRKKGVLLGDWWRGEKYARDIIENLEHWAVGWTDWNLCLDAQGGPSWVGNWVDAPVVVDSTRDEFLKQPMFYAIGHFSKFIRPGAVRVDHRLKHHGFHPFNTDLAATAALDLERQQLALVLQNRAAHKDYRVRVTKPGEEGLWLELAAPRNSIQTIIFQL